MTQPDDSTDATIRLAPQLDQPSAPTPPAPPPTPASADADATRPMSLADLLKDDPTP